MLVDILCSGLRYTRRFPMKPLELQDVLDRLHIEHGQHVVQFQFSSSNGEEMQTRRLYDRTFSADIFMLNAFVQRFQLMSQMECAVFAAVVNEFQPECFDEIFAMTYDLECVACFEADDFEEVGKFCIRNRMLTELEACPESLLPYFNRVEMGMLMAERRGGVLIGGCYCEPKKYEKPDMNITITKPEGVVFRLLIGPPDADGVKNAQWFDLPCSYEDLASFGDAYGMSIRDMECYDFESAVPNITLNSIGRMAQIHRLNAIADELRWMSPSTFTKFKAVMDAESICSLAGAEALLQRIDEYEFAPLMDEDEFGREYLRRNLPDHFDRFVLTDANLFHFGNAVLQKKNGTMTAYGVIVHGHDLYSELVQENVQSEEETEECDMQMGGMCE